MLMDQYWPAALFLLQGLMAWFIWSLRRSFVPKEDFDAHRVERHKASREMWDHINEQQKILAVINEELKSFPDHKEIAMLRDQVGAVQGDVKALVASLDGLRESQQRHIIAVDRIHEYLLNKDRKQ